MRSEHYATLRTAVSSFPTPSFDVPLCILSSSFLLVPYLHHTLRSTSFPLPMILPSAPEPMSLSRSQWPRQLEWTTCNINSILQLSAKQHAGKSPPEGRPEARHGARPPKVKSIPGCVINSKGKRWSCDPNLFRCYSALGIVINIARNQGSNQPSLRILRRFAANLPRIR